MKPKLGSIRLEFEESKIDLDLDGLFDIDKSNISEEYKQQASLFVYVAELMLYATTAEMEAKRKAENARGQAYIDIREHMSSIGQKPTEEWLKAKVAVDQVYQYAVEEANRTKSVKEFLDNLLEAMRQRGSMLRGIGERQAQEMAQTGMRTYDKQVDAAVDDIKAKVRAFNSSPQVNSTPEDDSVF